MSSIVVDTLLISHSARELVVELACGHRVAYRRVPPAADLAMVARTPDAIDNTWRGNLFPGQIDVDRTQQNAVQGLMQASGAIVIL
jgi:hypothetical protein